MEVGNGGEKVLHIWVAVAAGRMGPLNWVKGLIVGA